jgi:hypothetical protein
LLIQCVVSAGFNTTIWAVGAHPQRFHQPPGSVGDVSVSGLAVGQVRPLEQQGQAPPVLRDLHRQAAPGIFVEEVVSPVIAASGGHREAPPPRWGHDFRVEPDSLLG